MGQTHKDVQCTRCQDLAVHGGERWCLGLDFIFQVVGTACAKALGFVRVAPNSSMWLEQKVVNGRDGWSACLEMGPERKVEARSGTS